MLSYSLTYSADLHTPTYKIELVSAEVKTLQRQN